MAAGRMGASCAPLKVCPCDSVLGQVHVTAAGDFGIVLMTVGSLALRMYSE